MSVTQQIHWIHLKHLLLRHMYNLPLLRLCATLLVAPLSLEPTGRVPCDCVNGLTLFALYCAVLYIYGILGPFSPPFARKSFDACSKAAKQVLINKF